MVIAAEMAAHTVACYRNSTKCRICGEIIQKDRKKEHIIKFRLQAAVGADKLG